jgi:hypothetical protein
LAVISQKPVALAAFSVTPLRGRRGQAEAREGSSAAMSLKSDLHRYGEEVLSLGW